MIKEKFNSEIYIDGLENLQKIIKEKNIKQVILPYLNVGYENDFIQSIKKRFTKINDGQPRMVASRSWNLFWFNG